ncbi:MAG TPA: hypothetical protein VK211_25920 [Kamptonema sp.]|nr:hypothetical protein [Kamptonema sp.]
MLKRQNHPRQPLKIRPGSVKVNILSIGMAAAIAARVLSAPSESRQHPLVAVVTKTPGNLPPLPFTVL